MKQIITILLLALGLSATAQNADSLATQHPEYLPTLALGTTAPEILACDTLGTQYKLSDYRGKYVVLDFWATWCGDCRREIPMLQELFQKEELHNIKGEDNVQWLSFSFDEKEQTWRNFLRKKPFPWPQISNLRTTREDPTFKAFELHWIPAFFVIDPEGKIVGKAITAEGLENELLRIKEE